MNLENPNLKVDISLSTRLTEELVPHKTGVYLWSSENEHIYCGSASDLLIRIKKHRNRSHTFIKHELIKYGKLSLSMWFCTEDQLVKNEKALKEQFCPSHNKIAASRPFCGENYVRPR